MAFLIKDSKVPSKICISINSKSLGYTLFSQDDDDLLMKTSIKQLLIEVMILYAGRASEKYFLSEVTCGAEDDYMKARKILKRLLMNGMLIPQYNYVGIHEDTKLPDKIDSLLNQINKEILNQINILMQQNSEIFVQTAEKIEELGSIIGEDIIDIFTSTNCTNTIGVYDIDTLLNIIKSNILVHQV